MRESLDPHQPTLSASNYGTPKKMNCASIIRSFGILLAGLTTSQAASIVWNTPQNVAGDSDISLNGTLVAAFDIGSATNSLINGVNFVGTQSGDWGVGSYGSYGQPSAVTGTTYGTALNTGMYQTGNGSSWQVNLGASNIGTNLTNGQTYQVPIWFNDTRFGSETMKFSANNSAPFVTLNSTATTSQYVIGTFTATPQPRICIGQKQKARKEPRSTCSKSAPSPSHPLPLHCWADADYWGSFVAADKATNFFGEKNRSSSDGQKPS
jgi:hypothetical protein